MLRSRDEKEKAFQTKILDGKQQHHHHNMFYLFLIHVQLNDRNGRIQSNIYLIQTNTNRVRSLSHVGGWKILGAEKLKQLEAFNVEQ